MTPSALSGVEGIVKHVLTKTHPVLSIALCVLGPRSNYRVIKTCLPGNLGDKCLDNPVVKSLSLMFEVIISYAGTYMHFIILS